MIDYQAHSTILSSEFNSRRNDVSFVKSRMILQALLDDKKWNTEPQPKFLIKKDYRRWAWSVYFQCLFLFVSNVFESFLVQLRKYPFGLLAIIPCTEFPEHNMSLLRWSPLRSTKTDNESITFFVCLCSFTFCIPDQKRKYGLAVWSMFFSQARKVKKCLQILHQKLLFAPSALGMFWDKNKDKNKNILASLGQYQNFLSKLKHGLLYLHLGPWSEKNHHKAYEKECYYF